MLELIQTIGAMRHWTRRAHAGGQIVGFVPTMGALHAGHMKLVERARSGSDVVVASIFVNPIQFNDPKDYSRYPRTLDADLAICRRAGVDAVFAPTAEEMYPTPPLTSVDVAQVSEGLCGAFRPGHFRGVATVVAKLFNIVEPDRAYFGEKDAQQLAVIMQMVRDLSMAVEIVPVETVREPDGLALSSRNALLTAEERRIAPVLHQALRAAAETLRSSGDAASAERSGLDVLAREPSARVEYFKAVDAATMQPLTAASQEARIAAAAWLGSTRLIDNVRVDLSSRCGAAPIN